MKKKKVNHPLAEALAGVGKPSVHTLPKQKRSRRGNEIAVENYLVYLSLDDKQFPGIEGYAAGQTVNLAITCEVGHVNMSDDGNGKRYSAGLTITQISDITPDKGA